MLKIIRGFKINVFWLYLSTQWAVSGGSEDSISHLVKMDHSAIALS